MLIKLVDICFQRAFNVLKSTIPFYRFNRMFILRILFYYLVAAHTGASGPIRPVHSFLRRFRRLHFRHPLRYCGLVLRGRYGEADVDACTRRLYPRWYWALLDLNQVLSTYENVPVGTALGP